MGARDVPNRVKPDVGEHQELLGGRGAFGHRSGAIFQNTAAWLTAWPGPMRDSPSLCQGLHKQRFLPYVSGLRWRSASDACDRFGRPATPLRPCREDE